MCAPRPAYAEACYPRLHRVGGQRRQGLHPAGGGRDTSSSCRGAQGATVAAAFMMSLNSNLRKAAAFLHPHRHRNRTKKTGKNGWSMCKGSRLLLVGEEIRSLILRSWLQSQLQTVFNYHLWGKELHSPGPWRLSHRHPAEGPQSRSLPAPNTSRVGLDSVYKRLTTTTY